MNLTDPRNPHRDINVYDDLMTLSQAAAFTFAARAARAVRTRGKFTVALAGGHTPEALYRALAAPPYVDSVPWDHVHLLFGDERCVPPDDANSNFRLAQENLIAALPVAPAAVHRIQGEIDPEAAASMYEVNLRDAFELSVGEFPVIDLILLGMGPDGHCASLFPHKPALNVTDRLAVGTEPGLPPLVQRVTLTFPVINRARAVMFAVTGFDKAPVLVRVLEGPFEPDELPSQAVRPESGEVIWLLDHEAAAKLPF